MEGKGIYRSKRQEAIRKGMIAKLHTLARDAGFDKDDMYDILMVAANKKEITIYFDNYKVEGGKKRISLSSLKQWQLKQCIKIFDKKKPSAEVIEFKDWRKEK